LSLRNTRSRSVVFSFPYAQAHAHAHPSIHSLARSAMADYTGMRVADLQQELRARGLPTSGRKAELLARLQSATARAPAPASQPRHHAVPRSAASPETQSPDDSHVPPTRQSEPKAVKSSKKRKATASSIDEPRSKRPAATPASPMAAESGSSMASGPAGTLLRCPSRDASVRRRDLVLLATYPTHRMLYCAFWLRLCRQRTANSHYAFFKE